MKNWILIIGPIILGFILGAFSDIAKKFVKKQLGHDKKEYIENTLNEITENMGMILSAAYDPIVYNPQTGPLTEHQTHLFCSEGKQHRYSELKNKLQNTVAKLHFAKILSKNLNLEEIIPKCGINPFKINTNQEYFEVLAIFLTVIEKNIFMTNWNEFKMTPLERVGEHDYKFDKPSLGEQMNRLDYSADALKILTGYKVKGLNPSSVRYLRIAELYADMKTRLSWITS